MTIIDRIKALAATLGIAWDKFWEDSLKSFRPQGVILDDIEVAPTRSRSRVPHSNREYRRIHGIPHGYPGAKLARRAQECRIGVR